LKREESSRFFEKKRRKKLSLLAGFGLKTPTPVCSSATVPILSNARNRQKFFAELFFKKATTCFPSFK
jgi:uncharacterized membrane protein YraQ (UPF0718 family)